ncbi:MAG: hypothetical protein WCF23_19990 [Candidatus Nitrosopolaris sp.]
MSLPAHEIVRIATLPSSGVEIKFMQLLTIKETKKLIIIAYAFSTDFASFTVSTLDACFLCINEDENNWITRVAVFYRDNNRNNSE